jgi:hypothetical protein
MQRPLLVRAFLFLSVSIGLAVGAERAPAQGPAGAGASAVAQDSSHSLNPMNWLKKDSKNPTDVLGRSDLERKLTARLQAQGVLTADATATDACAPFVALDGCLASLHASHNLGLDFYCVRAAVTGVHTGADVSHCKVADGDKAQGLNKIIHQLKPDASAGQATKDAEQQAREDLKGVGG